jgi:glycosyltransferase involved in cell wall biosynthesis
MESKLPVTVCVPVRNGGKDLADCLESLGGDFAEVVVVDSQSTDGSGDVARRAGAEVLEFRWDGKFPKKRNWFLRTRGVRTPWVLFLDADERMTPEFVEELRRILPGTRHAGFWVTFDNWFQGRFLRHGDPFRKLALFRPEAGEYERFPEEMWSGLDMEVHEHPVLQGSVGEIGARLRHYPLRDAESYRAKHQEYAQWEARRRQWLERAGPGAWAALTRRQRFKYRNLGKWWLGPLYFLGSYVGKAGFLDGEAGWEFARLKLEYFWKMRRKVKEQEKTS